MRSSLLGTLMAAMLLPLTAVGAAAQETGGTAGPAVMGDAEWHLRDSLSGGAATTQFRYGRPGDVPVFGDWNGEGGQTPGVFRAGTWYLDNDYQGGVADEEVDYGAPGDIPVIGDWDGDGGDEIGVVRGRTWYLDADLDGDTDRRFRYGLVDDEPLAGDWDGDGVATAGVRRGAVFHLIDEVGGGEADHTFRYGRSEDLPVVGRWQQRDADRVGVVRGKQWFVRYELAGGAADDSFFYGRQDDFFLTWRAPSGPEETYTYAIGADGGPRGDLSRFAEVAAAALDDDRGWSLDGDIAYREVADRDAADFTLWLTDAENVGEKAPGCSDAYSCTVGDDIYINDENWNESTPTWDHRPLFDYRRYVINHEVGHWLGLDHHNDDDRCASDGAAPVMMQQSIDLRGCDTNVWPLPFEEERVRELRLR